MANWTRIHRYEGRITYRSLDLTGGKYLTVDGKGDDWKWSIYDQLRCNAFGAALRVSTGMVSTMSRARISGLDAAAKMGSEPR